MAGELAARVEAASLYLIHYQVWNTDPTRCLRRQQRSTTEPIALCKDLDVYEF
jgi:hypothetical protein